MVGRLADEGKGAGFGRWAVRKVFEKMPKEIAQNTKKHATEDEQPNSEQRV